MLPQAHRLLVAPDGTQGKRGSLPDGLLPSMPPKSGGRLFVRRRKRSPCHQARAVSLLVGVRQSFRGIPFPAETSRAAAVWLAPATRYASVGVDGVQRSHFE